MTESYILAIDQGTSGTKTLIFDSKGQIVSKATKELRSYFPQPGFVEQDPIEIYNSVLDSVELCLRKFSQDTSKNLENITTCGISNQRETFLLWDKQGNPLCNAIVWQCKRSVEICDRLKGSELENEVRRRTGLIIDPYFSGTKLIWLYENDPKIRNAIDVGQAYFGTVDTWLLFKLTCRRRVCSGAARRSRALSCPALRAGRPAQGQCYFTDHTNASRTLFFNINDLQWDKYLLDKFNLQNLNLPVVQPSSYLYGQSDFEGLLPDKINISAMIGDSHAAAFGEGCFSSGTAKATMGTGSSILLNTGSKRIKSEQGMVATICWSMPHRLDYALEGIIVTCGATINWLRDRLGLFADSQQTQQMALSVENNNGVYFIPAFSGLGAPHWKMNAKAVILGLTFGCDKNHIVRAALESIPYQIKDVIAAMETDSGIKLRELKVDGGITSNHFVMQFLADLLKTNVVNIGLEEVSALGAAYLAGLHEGIFKDIDQLKSLNVGQGGQPEGLDMIKADFVGLHGIKPAFGGQFSPGPDTEKVYAFYEGWKKALQQLVV